MRSYGFCCAPLALVLGIASGAAAGEHGAIAPSILGNMGLGNMQAMADHEGLAVRGMGTFTGIDSRFFSLNLGWGKQTKMDHKMVHHKKVVHHRMDPHRSFGKDFGHKSFGHSFGHKMGGGMIWQPKMTVWHGGFGGLK